jgi:hypothetical protein
MYHKNDIIVSNAYFEYEASKRTTIEKYDKDDENISLYIIVNYDRLLLIETNATSHDLEDLEMQEHKFENFEIIKNCFDRECYFKIIASHDLYIKKVRYASHKNFAHFIRFCSLKMISAIIERNLKNCSIE